MSIPLAVVLVSVVSLLCDTTVSLWVPGPCGAPDVPNGNITLQSNSSIVAVNESNFSKLAFSPEIQDLAKLSLQQPIKITLKITLLDSLTFEWDSILINKELYICIPNTTTDNSKEAFIALLEFAEEELYCRKVIVYFDKNKNDRNLLMRLFNFIGFTLLPPNHPTILTNQSDDMLYMEYNIEE